jgi:hypothetical protein
MKVRATPAAGAATLTVLVSVAVLGCTTSGSTHPAIFSPSAAASGSPASGASASASASASRSAAASASASRSGAARTAPPTASATPSPSASFTYLAPTAPATSSTSYPNGAPQTGGGGTAGLQDGTLLGVGAAAVVAGLGSLVYRRRVNKSR